MIRLFFFLLFGFVSNLRLMTAGKKMVPNSQLPSHVPGIYGNLNIFPPDFPKHKQFDLNPGSSLLFNPIQNTPSCCLTTRDSSSITHELDATCSILTGHYPNTPPSSSCLINNNTINYIPSSCSEILNDFNNQNLNNSLATYLPYINHSSNSSYKSCDGDWNGDEIYIQQEMNIDQNPSQFTDVMNLPNPMINSGHGPRHGSECLHYQPWLQPSQFHQQQRMGLMLDSNLPYYGSGIIGSGVAENALLMEMGIQEGLFDVQTPSDQLNKSTDNGIVDREFERKQDRKLKNRESAARSRFKKQAHVNYLENKSLRLKKENDLLNKELVFLRSIPRRRLKLRRTSSCEIIENKTHF